MQQLLKTHENLWFFIWKSFAALKLADLMSIVFVDFGLAPRDVSGSGGDGSARSARTAQARLSTVHELLVLLQFKAGGSFINLAQPSVNNVFIIPCSAFNKQTRAFKHVLVGAFPSWNSDKKCTRFQKKFLTLGRTWCRRQFHQETIKEIFKKKWTEL